VFLLEFDIGHLGKIKIQQERRESRKYGQLWSRQSAHRWWQGCPPYAPATIYSPETLFFCFMSLKVLIHISWLLIPCVFSICFRHFRKPMNIILEFLPQMLFLLLLFAYMVAMMFIKWAVYYPQETMDCNNATVSCSQATCKLLHPPFSLSGSHCCHYCCWSSSPLKYWNRTVMTFIHSFIHSFYLHSGDPNTGVTTP
jgi:hypothetical protein